MDKNNKNEASIVLRPNVDYRGACPNYKGYSLYFPFDPWKCDWMKKELRRKTTNMQADIDKAMEQ